MSEFSAQSVAKAYLCGVDEDKCRLIQSDIPIQKLLKLHQLYGYSTVSEDMMKVITDMHKNKACIYPAIFEGMFYRYNVEYEKDKYTEYYDHEWTVRLHDLRKNSEIKPLDIKIIKDWVSQCEHPIIGFRIGYFLHGTSLGHANVVCVNNHLKTVEHYDPHGSISGFGNGAYWLDAVDLLFKKLFPDYTYVSPWDTCPTKNIYDGFEIKYDGPQAQYEQQESPYTSTCALWSLWMLQVRIRNPQISSDKALYKAMEMFRSPYKKETIVEFLQEYMHRLISLINLKVFTDENGNLCYSSNGRDKHCPELDKVEDGPTPIPNVSMDGKYFTMSDKDVMQKLNVKELDRVRSLKARLQLQKLQKSQKSL